MFGKRKWSCLWSVPVLIVGLAAAGCEQKEKVLDIETPRGEIEVERDKSTGEIEVETSRKQ